MRVCPRSQCVSTVAVRTDLFQRDPEKVLITDFFGGVRNVEITTPHVVLENVTHRRQDPDGFCGLVLVIVVVVVVVVVVVIIAVIIAVVVVEQ